MCGKPHLTTNAPERWKPKPHIPTCLFKQPVVILDSGQSVDESVFCQYFRRWLQESLIARSRNDAPLPHVHCKYTSSTLWARYRCKGYETGHQEDRWEVGTLRLPGKPLYPWGMMETFANVEDGCNFGDSGKHTPPWRRSRYTGGQANRSQKTSHKRRGIPLYLNPTARDIEYLRRHQTHWQSRFRCPKIYLGYTQGFPIPKDIMPLVEGFYCLNPQDVAHIRDSIGPKYGAEIPTKKFRPFMGGITRKKVVSIAPNWRNPQRNRKSWAASWVKDALPGVEVDLPQRDATWQELLRVTDCGIYVILSERETLPFDAYLAAARGAIIVAPNTLLFQNIPMFRNNSRKKWLYSVRDYGHNRYGWSHTEVRHWLIPRLNQWWGHQHG